MLPALERIGPALTDHARSILASKLMEHGLGNVSPDRVRLEIDGGLFVVLIDDVPRIRSSFAQTAQKQS